MADVAMRQKETFQTDDGRCVEVYTKVKEIPIAREEDLEDHEFPKSDKIFVGLVNLPLGPSYKEIKFEIPDCEKIEDAFKKFHECAQSAAEQFYKILQEKMNQSKIVTAGADTLQEIDNQSKIII